MSYFLPQIFLSSFVNVSGVLHIKFFWKIKPMKPHNFQFTLFAAKLILPLSSQYVNYFYWLEARYTEPLCMFNQIRKAGITYLEDMSQFYVYCLHLVFV